jgi:hypothetical protein
MADPLCNADTDKPEAEAAGEVTRRFDLAANAASKSAAMTTVSAPVLIGRRAAARPSSRSAR